MDGPAVDPKKCLKTYSKLNKTHQSVTPAADSKPAVLQLPTLPKGSESRRLTTKNALELLLDGTLKSKVCRYCLNVASQLSHLDQILQVAGTGSLYNVAIKDIIASFYPFKVEDDPNFPNKICENCLDRAISCYLFTQQCEQSERALRNCFEDIYDKICKLDPLERTQKRGRQKLRPNYNILNVEHEKVIDYAVPIVNIVNTTSEILTEQSPISDLECLKCCEILPNLESLLNHSRKHPASMWYNCRLCGRSFAKRHHIKKHFKTKHSVNQSKQEEKLIYECKRCGVVYEKASDYIQHIEKHKFKTVMKHLVEKKMDRLCALCFNKGSKMTQVNKTICLHGICPELTGEKTLYNILTGTLPEMHLDTNTGTKICEQCLNNALTSYVFIAQSHFTRNRLSNCLTAMLDRLNTITDTNKNICIEIATNAIVNVKYDETLTVEDVEVLEDEFRVKSEDESEEPNVKKELIDVNRTNSKKNGFKYANDICREFLTFKKKTKQRCKFTCPICEKHFISDYFFKRHCTKHALMKVECEICELTFNSRFELYEHKKMSHLRVRGYLPCGTCGRHVLEGKLRRHEIRHRNPLCQVCDKRFVSQITYVRHMRRHMKKFAMIMNKYKLNCSFCERDCSNDNEFSLHVNKVHLQIKPYSCDMCERHFYTENNLRSHRKVHSVYSKEQCEFCNKILYSRKKLVIHIRKHIGDTPFYCQVCEKAFYSQFQLKKHLTMHHGGRFCCKLCKTTFVTKKELKLHTDEVHN